MILDMTSSFPGDESIEVFLCNQRHQSEISPNILEACSKTALREGKGRGHPIPCHWRH